MKRFGALFDLDGVLVDTESLYTRFWSGMEKKYPTGIEDYARAIKGMTLTRIFGFYEGDELQKRVVEEIHSFEASMVYPLMEGAAELLVELRREGIPAAIVTSSDSVKMSHLFRDLPELEGMVDAVIDASRVTLSKPHPQGYLLGAEAIGRRPEDCFVFEDSLQGLAAGRASGAMVIGLATTFPRERLEREARPDLIIDSLAGFSVGRMLELAETISRP